MRSERGTATLVVLTLVVVLAAMILANGRMIDAKQITAMPTASFQPGRSPHAMPNSAAICVHDQTHSAAAVLSTQAIASRMSFVN